MEPFEGIGLLNWKDWEEEIGCKESETKTFVGLLGLFYFEHGLIFKSNKCMIIIERSILLACHKL